MILSKVNALWYVLSGGGNDTQSFRLPPRPLYWQIRLNAYYYLKKKQNLKINKSKNILKLSLLSGDCRWLRLHLVRTKWTETNPKSQFLHKFQYFEQQTHCSCLKTAVFFCISVFCPFFYCSIFIIAFTGNFIKPIKSKLKPERTAETEWGLIVNEENISQLLEHWFCTRHIKST